MDWHPWGPEALAEAREQDKPILLSIGYSACHWCHVMERESFEDAETAALMNERFVPIKVDREERPDVDDIYMEAVQGMTGQGGWPLTVFLDPEGVPFYGGTYFPPEPRQGMPSFRQVLDATADGLRRASARRSARRRTACARRLSAVARHRALRARRWSPRCSTRPSAPARAAPTGPTAASAAPPSSRPPARSSSCSPAARREHVAPHARRDDARRHLRPRRRRLRPLRGGRRAGSSPTSRRCSTTTRCWRGPTCTAGR